ncbi:hypothetical protein AB0C10_36675 [Microbispora amethystogenes]|uniref:hypothetical protein n=1 Tax=Microbispora amethystogenes TaxID=1427754 RepID=UPI0033EB91EB
MTTPMIETDQRPAIDVRPLAYALHHMIPDLHAMALPGEDWDDMRARRDAALDILDDLLAEATAGAVA